MLCARRHRLASPIELNLPAELAAMGPRQLAAPLALALLLAASGTADAALLLDEGFGCGQIGCNVSGGITNYSYWRWSTTNSLQGTMAVHAADHGRTGRQVDFNVTFCPPPSPNPEHLGCYRSELALARSIQSSLIDWQPNVGSSERWFGFSNRLLDFTWDTTVSWMHTLWPPGCFLERLFVFAQNGHSLNGPSFQLHGLETGGWEKSSHR